jgi:hypothetical protein
MPAYPGKLADLEIKSLVVYLRTLVRRNKSGKKWAMKFPWFMEIISSRIRNRRI